MELYRKKINIQSKVNRRLREKYNEADSQPKESKNTYLHQMLKKKAVAQPRNEALNLSSENLQNVRSSVEDILADENNKKKAIKYVIQIGKNKKLPNSSTSYDIEPRYDRTESPRRKVKPYLKDFVSSSKYSPNRTYDDQRPQSLSKNNKYISINDYTNSDFKKNPKTSSTKKGNNYQNQVDSPNEYEMSSYDDDQRNYNNKSQEPKIMDRINRVLKDRYQKAEMKTQQQERRNRNIQAMPRIRKPSHNPNYSFNYGYNYIDTENDDIDDLIKTIEDLQNINKNLKRDNYRT